MAVYNSVLKITSSSGHDNFSVVKNCQSALHLLCGGRAEMVSADERPPISSSSYFQCIDNFDMLMTVVISWQPEVLHILPTATVDFVKHMFLIISVFVPFKCMSHENVANSFVLPPLSHVRESSKFFSVTCDKLLSKISQIQNSEVLCLLNTYCVSLHFLDRKLNLYPIKRVLILTSRTRILYHCSLSVLSHFVSNHCNCDSVSDICFISFCTFSPN